MGIIDAVIILFLLLGAVIGFKKGVIKSVVSFVGTILILLLSFWLKDPLAVFLYSHLPFFNFSIEAINIIIYEVIAFVLIFAVLKIVLNIVIKISGLLEDVLKMTVVLAIPSKILGAIFGFIESYLFLYIILFVLACFNVNSELLNESKLVDRILSSSPVISNVMEDSYQAIKEFTDLSKKEVSDEEKNNEAIQILLKYELISEDNLANLKAQNKIK